MSPSRPGSRRRTEDCSASGSGIPPPGQRLGSGLTLGRLAPAVVRSCLRLRPVLTGRHGSTGIMSNPTATKPKMCTPMRNSINWNSVIATEYRRRPEGGRGNFAKRQRSLPSSASMSEQSTSLLATSREPGHSREARRLRREGLVLGTVYGGGKDAASFQIDARTLRTALARAGSVIDLQIDGSTAEPVVLKERCPSPRPAGRPCTSTFSGSISTSRSRLP